MKKTNKLIFILLILTPLSSFSQLTLPTRYPNAVIPHRGGDILFFLYKPMIYEDNIGQDTFKLYYVDKKYWRTYLARSTNSGISWGDTQYVQTLGQWEDIIGNPDSTQIYNGFGKWRNDSSFMYQSRSTNGGYTFIDSLQVMPLGEDKSFIWNYDTDEYWGYVRPRNITPDCDCSIHNCFTIGNGVRKIALMKNSGYFGNMLDWSPRDTIVEVDPSDYTNSSSPDYRTQIYYMQVFRNGSDWWGLVGMYRVGNNGGETNDYPYTHPEYTSDVELMWSDYGESWFRTNNRQPIIPLHDSINTIYSVGTVVNDSLYIYSSESTILHAGYTTRGCRNTNKETSAFEGKFYSLYLYKMSLDKLNEWRPTSDVIVTCGIEGFLNATTNEHILSDTITAGAKKFYISTSNNFYKKSSN